MTEELREEVKRMLDEHPGARLAVVLRFLGIPRSTWYYTPRKTAKDGRKRGNPVAEAIVKVVIKMAEDNPWYGYKRIAVMCVVQGRR